MNALIGDCYFENLLLCFSIILIVPVKLVVFIYSWTISSLGVLLIIHICINNTQKRK